MRSRRTWGSACRSAADGESLSRCRIQTGCCNSGFLIEHTVVCLGMVGGRTAHPLTAHSLCLNFTHPISAALLLGTIARTVASANIARASITFVCES